VFEARKVGIVVPGAGILSELGRAMPTVWGTRFVQAAKQTIDEDMD
jgi:hypothetical protein